MKKLLVVGTLVMSLLVSPCFAIEFGCNIQGEGTNFQVFFLLEDVTEPLITAAMMIEYDPNLLKINSVTSTDAWDQGMSSSNPAQGQPGKYIIAAGNLSEAKPDANGNIGIATVAFECLVGNCDGQQIMVSTIPGFDSVVGSRSGVLDPYICPKYFDLNSTSTTTTTICLPTIDIKPKQIWRSPWVPIPYLMLITGREISKESFVDLVFYPQGAIFALPPLVWNEHYIWNVIWVLPGMGYQTGEITGEIYLELDDEVLHDEFEIYGNEPIEWKLPLPSFGGIFPDQGEQESTLLLEVAGKNTTFLDDGPVNLAFIPNYGDLTIYDIIVVNNETLEFTLDIAVNAAIGPRTVVVTYDDGNKSLVGNNVFEVREKR